MKHPFRPLWIPKIVLASLVGFAACSSSSKTTGPTIPGPSPSVTQPVTADPVEAAKPPGVRLDRSVEPVKYAAALWLDPTKATLKGEITIDLKVNEPLRVVWLNAEKINIEKAEWMSADHGALKPASRVSTSTDDALGLDLGETIAPGAYRLVIRYNGQTSGKDFSGAFVQESEGKKYLYTQFESMGARRVFPSFDQPEFKTPWRLTIHAPAGNLAFSNTPEKSHEQANGLITYHFAETKPVPSYLIAFAVGPFAVVDLGQGGRNKTPLRAIVPQGMEKRASYAKANMAKILSTLEDYFDLAYPYAKLDSVAIPDFFGAMENPGLITYAAGLLLSDPAKETQRFRESHTSVVAHEVAHQWFGDLVTLRWWNDIWLNEAFATWLGTKVTAQLHPEWDGDISAVATRNGVMGQDSLASARKIRQEIRTKADISAAFDGITYQKGGAVISMFETWVGADAFRKAAQEYVRTYAWKTTTADDFLDSLAKASDSKLPAAFSTFLDQSGVPMVTMNLQCEKSTANLMLTQGRYVPTGSKAKATDGLWQIPVCVKYGTGSKTYQTCELMSQKSQPLKLNAKAGCPKWVLGNAASKGYYRVAYNTDLTDRLLKASRKLTTAERIGVMGDISAQLSAGQIEIGTALGLIPRFIRDHDPQITRSAAGIARGVKNMVPPRLQANYERFLGKMFGREARKLGWNNRKSDSRETKLLRASIVPLLANDGHDRILVKKAGKLARKWLNDRSAIDRDALGATLSAAARNGDEKLYGLFYAELKATKDQTEQGALVRALGSFPQKKLVPRSLDLVKSEELPLGVKFLALNVVMQDATRRQLAYDYVKENYATIATQLPPMARGFLAMVAVPFCDEEHKSDAITFFGKKTKEMGAGDRALSQAVEAIDLCIAQRKAQGPSLTKFLRKY